MKLIKCAKCKKYRKNVVIHGRSGVSIYYYCRKCNADVCNKYYKKNSQKIISVRKLNPNWRLINKRACERWSKKNHKKVKEYRRISENRRYHSNKKHRIESALRASISYAIHNNKFTRMWEKVTGLRTSDLFRHLENQFYGGMNWDNYGGKNGWQIDHVIPRFTFKYRQIKSCWSLENLQPLWRKDNQLKHKKDTFIYNKTKPV